MNDYYYFPLSKPDNIRLLQLLPGRDPTALHCNLLEYPLGDSDSSNHLYEALSYVWGSEEKPQSIRVGDQRTQLRITQNLYSVLCRLKNRRLPRMLWVDALCINQTDNTEKQYQIPLMAEIYAKANQVLVWLGDSEHEGDQALKAISLAGELMGSSFQHTDLDRRRILKLLRRSWFKRVWVLQEVGAARSIQIMCGSVQIDGQAFCLGLDALGMEIEGSTIQVAYLIRGAIFRSRNLVRNKDRFSLNICSLRELVNMYHGHEATKAHDKVYALLGMCSDDLSTAGLEPNYSLDWNELMQRLVTFILGYPVSIDTSEAKAMAFFQVEGYVLGQVKWLGKKTAASRRSLEVSLNYRRRYSDDVHTEKVSWELSDSVIPVQEGDWICLFKSHSKPSIIRSHGDHFLVIVIDALPSEVSNTKFWSRLKTKEIDVPVSSPQRFSLLWSWKPISRQDMASEWYDHLIKTTSWGMAKGGPLYELRSVLMTWDVVSILRDIGEEGRARVLNSIAVQDYETNMRGELHSTTKRELRYWERRNSGRRKSSLYSDRQTVPLVSKDEYATAVHRDVAILSWASIQGDKHVVEGLLATDGTEADAEAEALFWAVLNGHEEIIKFLLKRGKVDINHDFPSLLLSSAAYGHEAVVKLLIEANSHKVDIKDHFGRTALAEASINGNLAIVKVLLETGKVYVNSMDKLGRTPVSWAAYYGRGRVLELLLRTDKTGVDTRDFEGRTPLTHAVIRGHTGVVMQLLGTKQVDINSRSLENIKLLRTLPWSAESREKNSLTPLHWACKNKHKNIVEILLGEQPQNDVEARDGLGRTSLLRAVEERDIPMVRLLLEKGKANVDAKDDQERTPLSIARGLLPKEVEMIKFLQDARPSAMRRIFNSVTAR